LIRRPRLHRSHLIAKEHQTKLDASDRITFVVK
jgi:hypothetical protein